MLKDLKMLDQNLISNVMLKDFKLAYKHNGYHNNAIWHYDFDTKNIIDECTKNFDKFTLINTTSELGKYISNERYFYPKGNGIKPIDNFLLAFENSIKECLTNIVHNKPVFESFIQPSWPFPPDEWLDYMSIDSKIVSDNNGYNMGVHEDSNKVVCNFIANISENSCGTKFYHPVFENEDNWKNHFLRCKNKVVYEAPGKAGTGICWFNSKGSLHSIDVNGDRRFTVMAGLHLNLTRSSNTK